MTNDGRMTYNFAAITDAGTNTSKHVADMEGIFDDLMKGIKTIVGELRGETLQALEARHKEWDLACAELNTCLRSLGDATVRSAADIQALDLRMSNTLFNS